MGQMRFTAVIERLEPRQLMAASATDQVADPSGTRPALMATAAIAQPSPLPAGVPAPAPGAKLIRVVKGTAVPTIARAAALAQPGDVVLIAPGRYRESVRLTRSGTTSRPIVFAAATKGTVFLDGTGLDSILTGTASYIQLKNLVLENCSGGIWHAALEIGSGWRVTDCTVRRSQGMGALVRGNGAVLTRSVFEYNGQEGLSGDHCTNVLVKDCVTRYNNPGLANPVWAGQLNTLLINGKWYIDPSWQGGPGKWVQTDHVTLDGLQSYGNRSGGICFDYNNTNVVIRNCVVHDNFEVRTGAFWESIGLSIELNPGPVLVENNRFYNHHGGHLVIQSSRRVTVRGNTFTGNYLALNDYPRGANYTLQDLAITNNRFTADAFVWAGGGTWDLSSPLVKRIRFDSNRWESHGGDLFRWASFVYRSLTPVRLSLGYEVNGTYVRL